MIRILYNNVNSWDNQLCLKIANLNGRKSLDFLMYCLSRLGDGYFYAFIGSLLFIIDFDLAFKIVPAGLVAFFLQVAVQKIIKSMTKRERPFQAVPGISSLIQVPDKFSFPSGHTAAAFVMATLFGTVIPVLFIPLVIVALFIGFSRIYNGLHFPSDVLAGMTLGITCAKIGLAIAA